MKTLLVLATLFVVVHANGEIDCRKAVRSVGDTTPTIAPLFILSGPSGAGKTTVLKQALQGSKVPVRASVSVTTRGPRPMEIDGQDYYFWTREQFETAIKAGEF